MVPSYIFYNELPIDENNIFEANKSEKTRYKTYSLKNPTNML